MGRPGSAIEIEAMRPRDHETGARIAASVAFAQQEMLACIRLGLRVNLLLTTSGRSFCERRPWKCQQGKDRGRKIERQGTMMTQDLNTTLSRQMAEVDELCREMEGFVANEYSDMNEMFENFEIFEKYISLMGRLTNLFALMDQFVYSVQGSNERMSHHAMSDRFAA